MPAGLEPEAQTSMHMPIPPTQLKTVIERTFFMNKSDFCIIRTSTYYACTTL